MPDPVERRANPRFACDVDAQVRLSDGTEIAARTQDISFSGICVVAGAEIPPRTAAEFRLRLMLGEAESEPLVLPGQVVWCTRVRDGHQVGARFEVAAMGDDAWQRLDVFLRFLRGELALPREDAGDREGGGAD